VVALSNVGKVYTIAADAQANDFGQLGNGSIDPPKGSDLGSQLTPVKGLEKKTVVQIAAGSAFNVVRSKDGSAFVWGSNNFGVSMKCWCNLCRWKYL
jgi:alpha-tubulin suppressor-like RCC1 family protein